MGFYDLKNKESRPPPALAPSVTTAQVQLLAFEYVARSVEAILTYRKHASELSGRLETAIATSSADRKQSHQRIEELSNQVHEQQAHIAALQAQLTAYSHGKVQDEVPAQQSAHNRFVPDRMARDAVKQFQDATRSLTQTRRATERKLETEKRAKQLSSEAETLLERMRSETFELQSRQARIAHGPRPAPADESLWTPSHKWSAKIQTVRRRNLENDDCEGLERKNLNDSAKEVSRTPTSAVRSTPQGQSDTKAYQTESLHDGNGKSDSDSDNSSSSVSCLTDREQELEKREVASIWDF